MNDTLLNNLERINVVAELLLDLINDNPRAQVLTEIIIEASQGNYQYQQQNQTYAHTEHTH